MCRTWDCIYRTCVFFGLKRNNSDHVSSSQHRENCLAAQSLFINFCLTPTSLQVELLPYLAKLSNPMRNPGTPHCSGRRESTV